MTTIITKNGVGIPSDGQLAEGELAVSPSTAQLFTSSNGTDIIELVGGSGGELPDGSTQYDVLSWTGASWTATGNVKINYSTGTVTCATPTSSTHAATKGYVDAKLAGQASYAFIDQTVVQYGSGISSVTSNGTGDYNINWSQSATSTNSQVVQVTCHSQTSIVAVAFYNSSSQTRVRIFGVDGNPTNGKYMVSRTFS